MKTSLMVLLLGVMIVGSSVADSDSNARRSIHGIYKTIDAAMARRDLKTASSLLTKSYQLIPLKGQRRTKADVTHSMGEWFTNARSIKGRTTIKSMRVTTGKVMATIQERANVTLVDQRTKKVSTLISDTVAEETWIKIKGRWLKQKTKVLSLRLVLDGKVLALINSQHKSAA